MSINKYFLFILLPFLHNGLSACQHTVAKLNTMFLTPLPKDDGANTMTIGTLFTQINKHGVPASGTVEIKTLPESMFWHYEKGLPKNLTGTIFIHSCPRDGTWQRIISSEAGHSLLCCNQWLKNYIINAPLITFDHQFDTKHFDFGASRSIVNFNKIYTETTKNNTCADVVIAGTCIGAKIALEFLAAHPAGKVKAVILESPFADYKKVMQNWHTRYIPLLPFGSKIIHGVFKGLFSQVAKAPNTLLERLDAIPKDIPLFIAHLDNDSFISNQDMKRMIDALRSSGNTDIHLLVIKDTSRNHGHLNRKQVFAQATNAFLAKYNLPHNAALAEQGKSLLADAHTNAYATSEKDWAITIEAN